MHIKYSSSSCMKNYPPFAIHAGWLVTDLILAIDGVRHARVDPLYLSIQIHRQRSTVRGSLVQLNNGLDAWTASRPSNTTNEIETPIEESNIDFDPSMLVSRWRRSGRDHGGAEGSTSCVVHLNPCNIEGENSNLHPPGNVSGRSPHGGSSIRGGGARFEARIHCTIPAIVEMASINVDGTSRVA